MYRSNYPPNWEQISRDIREVRAQGKCEWCGLVEGSRYPGRSSIVRLACAHIGIPRPDGTLGSRHDKSDCRPENLRALCQRCHLDLDRQDHALRQAANRAARSGEKLAKMGFIQLELC